MPDEQGQARDGWVSRLRERRADRQVLRADRRARRRGRFGGNADDAARQAESGNFQSGGYFTTKTRPKP